MIITVDEDTGDAIGFCLALDREKLIAKRDRLQQRIDREDKTIRGGESARVARSFHLGTVGGSGRAVRGLNKRRAREVERVIDSAVRISKLRTDLQFVLKKIAYIDSGSARADAEKRAVRRQKVESRVRISHDDPRRVMTAMCSGDCEYTLSDGSFLQSWAYWDKEKRDSVGFVQMTTLAGDMYLKRAKSIQGVDFGRAGTELAMKYLAGAYGAQVSC